MQSSMGTPVLRNSQARLIIETAEVVFPARRMTIGIARPLKEPVVCSGCVCANFALALLRVRSIRVPAWLRSLQRLAL